MSPFYQWKSGRLELYTSCPHLVPSGWAVCLSLKFDISFLSCVGPCLLLHHWAEVCTSPGLGLKTLLYAVKALFSVIESLTCKIHRWDLIIWWSIRYHYPYDVIDKLFYKNLFLKVSLWTVTCFFVQYLMCCSELLILRSNKLILLCQNVNIISLSLNDFEKVGWLQRLYKPASCQLRIENSEPPLNLSQFENCESIS